MAEYNLGLKQLRQGIKQVLITSSKFHATHGKDPLQEMQSKCTNMGKLENPTEALQAIFFKL